jgi:hypothetical protein
VSVTYTAVLDVSEDSVEFVSDLLARERVRRGTRDGTRALGVRDQALLVLRWFFDDTRMTQLARDNAISVSTAYAYRDEAITVLASRKPSLHGALLAAKAAGHTHVILDGRSAARARCGRRRTRSCNAWRTQRCVGRATATRAPVVWWRSSES